MTAVIVNEGRKVMADLLFGGSSADHQTSLTLGLFTNSSGLSQTSVIGDIAQPTGGSYATKTLTGASWTIAADGDCTRADEVFTASGSDYSAPVYGWFLYWTGGGADRLFAYEIDASGPRTILDTYTYTVKWSDPDTLKFNLSPFLCDQAEEMIATVILTGTHADRGTGMLLRLYTNSGVLDNTFVAASITEPADATYSAATIANGTWSISATGVATYAQQSFTPDGGSWDSNVHGFALVTSGGTAERIVMLHEDPNDPITSDYNVDLDIAA